MRRKLHPDLRILSGVGQPDQRSGHEAAGQPLCYENLEIRKQLFAITQEQFKIETNDFLARSRSGTLPEPAHVAPVEICEEAGNAEKTEPEQGVVEKLYDLFGTENVEIIEEE